jgi:hypothetical protein
MTTHRDGRALYRAFVIRTKIRRRLARKRRARRLRVPGDDTPR